MLKATRHEGVVVLNSIGVGILVCSIPPILGHQPVGMGLLSAGALIFSLSVPQGFPWFRSRAWWGHS